VEWTKLILEHLVQVIHYIAWPGIMLAIALIFRKPLESLLNRLIKVGKGDTYAQFASVVQKESVEELHVTDKVPDTKAVPELSCRAKRILTTLWKGQHRHYTDISEGQWGFRVTPAVYEYGNFIVAFSELLKLGLIGWEAKYGQAVLTKKGYAYIKDRTEIQNSDDYYPAF
jgi:hypothetical protein